MAVNLSISDGSVKYGNKTVLSELNIEISNNEIVALLGANGAGKSSLVKSILNLESQFVGEMKLNTESITAVSTLDRVNLGIALVPEGRHVFPRMTVEENLELGCLSNDKSKLRSLIDSVYADFPKLGARKNQLAGTLSGGEQQMLAISRALMSEPSLLMLDEPTLGLAPIIVKDVMNLLIRLKNNGMAILLAEQNARVSLEVADRGYVLSMGKVAIEGDADYLLNSSKVREAYLGK